MRPLARDDVLAGRSRNASFSDATPLARPQQPEMTFFLADEKTMEASLSASDSPNHQRRYDHTKRSTFGVESLDTITSSLSHDSDGQEHNHETGRKNWKNSFMNNMQRSSQEDMASSYSPSSISSAGASRNMSPSAPRSRPSQKGDASQPITPSYLESPILGTLSTNPHSRRNSEIDYYMDDNASRAILSSGEDESAKSPEVEDGSHASQLVMPSLQLPTRRPFTDKGKTLGRLKILIAGDSGVGKTSLIKAVVQTCTDIVHVDPLSATPSASLEMSRRKSKSKSRRPSNFNSTTKISEIYASTRPYPHWWSDFDDGKVLRRRKSMGDTILERNICFVDTPGYSNGTSCMECITPVVEYIEAQYKRALSPDTSDPEIISMLSGGGGSQVDVVFYVILGRLKPVDIEYLRRLSQLTNVVPIVAQSEGFSSDKLQEIKEHIRSELQAANVRPFLLGINSQDGLSESQPQAPYAVSTILTNEDEIMDASLLMSPDYVQPLIPTELTTLVSQVFNHDTISWLRHSAAKKCLQYHRGSPSSSQQLRSIPQSIFDRPSNILTTPLGSTNTYALARIADHTQREERLAQVRLSKWAADLQRSLQNERARFEALAKGERAVWLTERLGECVADGTLIPISAADADARLRGIESSESLGAIVGKGNFRTREGGETGEARGRGLDRRDPLGLLRFNAEVRESALLVLRVVGGCGAIGGLAFWLVRSYTAYVEGQEVVWWGREWGRALVDW